VIGTKIILFKTKSSDGITTMKSQLHLNLSREITRAYYDADPFMNADIAKVTPLATSRKPTIGMNVSFPLLDDENEDTIVEQDSFHSDDDHSSSTEDSVGAAILLTSVMNIASREVGQEVSSHKISARKDHLRKLTIPNLNVKSDSEEREIKFELPHSFLPLRTISSDMEESDDAKDGARRHPFKTTRVVKHPGAVKRMRTVSIDANHSHAQDFPGSYDILDAGSPPMSPEPVCEGTYVTPTGKRKKIVGPSCSVIVTPAGEKRERLTLENARDEKPSAKTTLRRKFSWKNYPELEAFLVANRKEYLRHSALNYTVQQKQFNNRLTEQLIELAETHGYTFDQEVFNFVAIRDRIRCYFKSYVQSSKKRGVIIGYAAKKAGLLTDKELEQSASTAGKIILPG